MEYNYFEGKDKSFEETLRRKKCGSTFMAHYQTEKYIILLILPSLTERFG